MATKKRVTQYQYEPPITPRHWSGDELNYAVKLSQTLDDIYNKYSALREALKEKGEGGGGGIAVETDPTVPAWAKEENPPSYTKSDVGLSNVANERQYSASNPPPYPVKSVNGKTGNVVIELPDSGITEEVDPTVPNWAKAASKPSYTKSEVGLGNVVNVLQYSASNPPPYPVTSVNGQTGDVTVETGNASDPYPVGAIYISTKKTSPASLFGGTWERIMDRFLLGAGTTYAAGKTGGSATHALTVDEIPSHYHDFAVKNTSGNTTLGLWDSYFTNSSYIDQVYDSSQNIKANTYGTRTTGGGAAHNNMPPYLTVYIWKRVA